MARDLGLTTEDLDDSVDLSSDIRRVTLDSGAAMTVDDVYKFLQWRAATFVTIIGDSHSGKTTLICALYDRFLKGPFSGTEFVGSRTLVALEQWSHHARVDSGRVTPETARTSHLAGLRYFHVAVAPVGSPRDRTDLLLSDRSGEMYRSARDNSSVVETLFEIPQADRIVLLLDGSRLIDPLERAGALQSVRQTLRVLVDNGALGPSSTVQVVTTKLDLISASADKDEVTQVVSRFRQRLTTDFARRLKSLSFYDIAARDPSGVFAPAFGLDALVSDWVTPSARYVPKPAETLESRSEFDRLLERTKWSY